MSRTSSGRMPHRASRPHVRKRRGGSLLDAPIEPEHRPTFVEPLPPGDIAELFAEMFANDPEAIEWRRSEERAEWAVRR